MDPDLGKVDALCRTHGYPDAVRSLLRDVTAALAIDGVRSVVLSGSGARGELIYAEAPHGVRWFSDLDVTVVADSLPGAERAQIEKQVAVLEERQLAIGARTFHIDVDFASSDSWRQPRQNFQAWETRDSGWVLYGEELRDQLEVEVDSRTCVQSSLNRLWHLLLYLPENVLRGRPSDLDREVMHYILNRATLDFPLWLLLERGELVAGFAGRQQFLEQHGSDLATSDFEIDEFVSFTREAQQGRATPGTERSLEEHYAAVLRWYVLMLRRSLGRPDIDEGNLPVSLSHEHNKIYPDLGLRRRLWELKLALEIAASGKPVAALRWVVATKQVQITGFLWAMHQAARSILAADEAEAGQWLQRAATQMRDLWPGHAQLTDNAHQADRWVELRLRFFDFVVQHYRGLESKRAYYNFVLASQGMK
jgi:predicted nucleotidyltransferase